MTLQLAKAESGGWLTRLMHRRPKVHCARVMMWLIQHAGCRAIDEVLEASDESLTAAMGATDRRLAQSRGKDSKPNMKQKDGETRTRKALSLKPSHAVAKASKMRRHGDASLQLRSMDEAVPMSYQEIEDAVLPKQTTGLLAGFA